MKRKIILLLLFLGFLISNNLKAQNDSTNHISFINKSRAGLYFRSNQAILSFNTFMIFSKSNVYESGIGSGIEYLNRGSEFITITQIPFLWTNHFFMNTDDKFPKKNYFIFEVGYIVPLTATYQNDITHYNVDLTADQLKGTAVFNLGFGFTNSAQNLFGEISVRNQSMGITYPVNDNYFMLGINLGFRLWKN